jgi:osmotically-inducible protein OsmY
MPTNTPRISRVEPSSADRRLERSIARRLAATSLIGDDDVTVTVDHGQVRLTGSVESHSERLMCSEVAESLGGLGSVHNDIHVRPFDEREPGPSGVPDASRRADPR